jgi:hypothetical protein
MGVVEVVGYRLNVYSQFVFSIPRRYRLQNRRRGIRLVFSVRVLEYRAVCFSVAEYLLRYSCFASRQTLAR